jgi:hypothetical protein
MTVTITGVSQAPTWVALEKVVRTALNQDGNLTRIKRTDNGCNYRAPGDYLCTFTPENGDETPVHLAVMR